MKLSILPYQTRETRPTHWAATGEIQRPKQTNQTYPQKTTREQLPGQRTSLALHAFPSVLAQVATEEVVCYLLFRSLLCFLGRFFANPFRLIYFL